MRSVSQVQSRGARYFATTPERGFTLVELIIVIVIMGVIAGMVSVFMKSPIDAYFASSRRAALTDVADTALRRITRDVKRALPNSVRTNGSQCLEFIPTKTGARYRAQDIVSGDGTSLDFVAAGDTSFNMLGSNTTFAGSPMPAERQIVSGDVIVVYNMGSGLGSDAYDGTNTASVGATPTLTVASPPETTIAVISNQPASSPTFPLSSPSNRFQVISANEKLVSYVCSGATLHRTVSSTLSTTALCPVTGPIVATNVNCASTTFNYSGSDLHRNALVSMVLTIQDSSSTETVTLQHQVHVSNTP